MDQETRNKLQRATQQIRRILEAEFAEQLEGTFDILQSGQILPNPGKHLDARQRLTRQKLVDAIEHIKASGKSPKEAVDTYTREAAFTFLNRFVALRMLEARGLLQECVSKGDQSSGFKEFSGLAPGLSALPDGGYRLYLECLFDELSVEVKVLFDRRDPASLLWPRRTALNEVLDILGQADLAGIWREDETIGWVYQYFNSSEERKKMREESSAPRNSRELAVRNQFFTPRYVVEFLTDNTLGRIWYEMRQGETRLKDQCRYLVRRPSEVFLADGHEPPTEPDTPEDLTQEELLKKTEYVPHRPKKDPRALKVLDPACGSGHFLLYAFDLLSSIYEEAYDDADLGPVLKHDYQTLEAFQHDVPRLILAHNLHGIDIDPRATQIASLALWMRAQRAWQEAKVPVRERPPVRKSNIVCAEPMPGDERMLKEFVAQLEPKVLGQLVEVVFDKMKLAGEAGSLLKIEEEIRDAVTSAKEQFVSNPLGVQQSLFEDMVTPAKQQQFDLSGVNDEDFFEQAESLVLDSLRRYAEQAQTGYLLQRRLFAEDAARGFAFIDLCRRSYDVVLMNPPFGEGSSSAKSLLAKAYPLTKHDVYAAFIDAAIGRGKPYGKIGALTARTGFYLSSFTDWREKILLNKSSLSCLADLGFSVLDGAMVETAAYCLTIGKQRATYSMFIRLFEASDRAKKLFDALNSVSLGLGSECITLASVADFSEIPTSPFAYWLPPSLRDVFKKYPRLEGAGRQIKQGIATGDNDRFLRLRWEVDAQPTEDVWKTYAKGGDYAKYYSDLELVVSWKRDGAEVKARASTEYGSESRTIKNQETYFRPGLTYTLVSVSGFSCRALPAEAIYDMGGPALFLSDGDKDPEKYYAILAFLNSSIAQYLLRLITDSRHWHVFALQRLPFPSFTADQQSDLVFAARSSCLAKRQLENLIEPSSHFLVPWSGMAGSLKGILKGLSTELSATSSRLMQWQSKLDCIVNGLFRTDLDSLNDTNLTSDQAILGGVEVAQLRNESSFASAMISHFAGVAFGRWDIRYATGDKPAPELPNPFAPLPVCPPGQLQDVQGLPAKPKYVPASYPIDIPWDGIIVDDPNHPFDIMGRVRHVIELIWKDKATDIEHEAAEILGVKELRDYFRKSGSGGFWPDHIKRYSKSRRKAPIYWQLATPSGSYSVWLYYHRFDKDTFFKAHEHVKNKLDHERRKLDRVRAEAGPQPSRSQQKDIEEQERFVAEIATMAEEVERIAPLWNPNLNDGVIINFAPLWRLVPQNKAWQKECRECWDTLIKGEYDWSHLAMHLWPERVVPKCVTDASLAIAHGLEDVFWKKDDRDRYQPKPEPDGGWRPVIDEIVKQRTSPAVKAALKSLMEAPTASATSPKGKRGRGKASSG